MRYITDCGWKSKVWRERSPVIGANNSVYLWPHLICDPELALMIATKYQIFVLVNDGWFHIEFPTSGYALDH